jgi:hypothetical protein
MSFDWTVHPSEIIAALVIVIGFWRVHGARDRQMVERLATIETKLELVYRLFVSRLRSQHE